MLLHCLWISPPVGVQSSMRRWSVFDATLREDAFLVGVFDLAHFGDGVGEFDEEGVGIAAGENNVQHFRPASKNIGDSFRVISGVSAGDTIVTSGVQNLSDGATISPQT